MGMLIRVVGGLLILSMLALGGLLIGARLSDGPMAIIAGGPFTSGTLTLASGTTLDGDGSLTLTVKSRGRQLEQIGALMSEGKVEVVVEQSFPITEIASVPCRG